MIGEKEFYEIEREHGTAQQTEMLDELSDMERRLYWDWHRQYQDYRLARCEWMQAKQEARMRDAVSMFGEAGKEWSREYALAHPEPIFWYIRPEWAKT